MSAATVLLVCSLVLPIVLFWLLRVRARWSALRAALFAIAIGWACGIAWAATAGESLLLASAFGWFCPTVLVGLTALVRRLLARRP